MHDLICQIMPRKCGAAWRKTKVAPPICALFLFHVLIAAPGTALGLEGLDDQLVAAVKRDDLADVTRLISAGANPNARLPDRWAVAVQLADPGALSNPAERVKLPSCSVLALAVERKNAKIVHELLAHGASGVDETPYVLRWGADFSADVERLPLLLIALGNSSVDIVRDLLDHGAHVVPAPEHTDGPLTRAFYTLDGRYIPAEVRKHTNRNRASLRTMVGLLLSHGQDVHEHGHDGETALDRSVHFAVDDVADMLLRRGVKPDEGTGWDCALGYAALRGDLPLVKRLIHSGASLKRRNSSQTPIAIDGMFHTEILRYLVRCGADINDHGSATPYGDATALHVAAAYPMVQQVRALVSLGANVNARRSDGETPLMSASRHGNAALVKFLLSHGARPNLRDAKRRRALDYVKGNRAIIRVLKRYGARKGSGAPFDAYD
jgi:ankyrin repeat protein